MGGKTMYAKIQIKGKLMVKTGMHIGGNGAFAAIGAVDSPVIKDPVSCNPMIPGTSLKGKMRSLLAKEYNTEIASKPDDDCDRLVRLFGSAKKDAIKRSRVLFADLFMSNEAELRGRGLQSMTEVKFENTVSRTTAIANPRQIERIVRGAEFDLEIVYEVENPDEIYEDMETLYNGFRLIKYDYIGGNGTRGYGKVDFKDLEAVTVVGSVDEDIISRCNELLNIV